jgi:hypothetical protein
LKRFIPSRKRASIDRTFKVTTSRHTLKVDAEVVG